MFCSFLIDSIISFQLPFEKSQEPLLFYFIFPIYFPSSLGRMPYIFLLSYCLWYECTTPLTLYLFTYLLRLLSLFPCLFPFPFFNSFFYGDTFVVVMFVISLYGAPQRNVFALSVSRWSVRRGDGAQRVQGNTQQTQQWKARSFIEYKY